MTKSTRAEVSHPAPLQVGVHEAKTRLSELLRVIEGGQPVEILRNGRPVARLVPFSERQERQFGVDRGRFQVPDDFDAPLPDDLLESFEGPVP